MSDQQLVPYAQLQAEIAALKGEMQISKLKFDLEKLQAEKSSRLEDSLYSPKLYKHYREVAEGIAKSKMIPTIYQGKPDDIFIAMAYGYQLGFPLEQALQDIAVVNGRPCLWGDGMLAVVMSHAAYEKHTEQPIFDQKNPNDCIGYICTVWRKGQEPHAVTFTKADAVEAGLWGRNTWKQYPKRMMQLRARAFALRDKFADALRGIRQAEVERDEPDDSFVIEHEAAAAPKNLLDAIRAKQGQAVTPPTPNAQSNQTQESCQVEENEPVNEEKSPETGEIVLLSDSAPDLLHELDMLSSAKIVSKEQILKMLDHFNVSEFKQLTIDQAKRIIAHLNKFEDKQ